MKCEIKKCKTKKKAKMKNPGQMSSRINATIRGNTIIIPMQHNKAAKIPHKTKKKIAQKPQLPRLHSPAPPSEVTAPVDATPQQLKHPNVPKNVVRPPKHPNDPRPKHAALNRECRDFLLKIATRAVELNDFASFDRVSGFR